MNELNGYKVSDCVHAVDLYENEIKEVCCQCDEYGHRNITLGDCFGNCDCQESDDTVLEKIVARLRGEFTNLIPNERPDAIVYNMGYAAAIRDLEHIVEEVIVERRDNSGGDGRE